ncbi:MAG: membrane protein insertase YidC [Gammaproteobacteria bacterium]|nr:membrane protein insertase YidC [Gammaproteobacteria bacterium]
MDFQRLLLFAGLSFTLLMIWEAWQNDYVRPQQQAQEIAQNSAANRSQDLPGLPKVDAPATVADAPAAIVQQVKSSQRISVVTDGYNLEIDTLGGDLRRVDLVNYPISKDEPNSPFRLMDDEGVAFFAQSGLLTVDGDSKDSPTHHDIYTAAQSSYSLKEGEDRLDVELTWKGDNGLEVTKVYRFHRGSYLIDVDYKINNGGESKWQGHLYHQLQRQQPTDENNMFMYTYTGGVLYTDAEKYEKITFDDMAKGNISRTNTGGWVAMIQHYFLGAWIPPQQENINYYTKKGSNERFIIGGVGDKQTINSGESVILKGQLFVGPKLQSALEETAPGLELTVDYGFLTIIAKPLYWMLDFIHSFVGNWGWAIIFLTVLIKAVFYKLSETSYKSMAHMRKVQPKLVTMKERYKDDKQGMNQAMMKLYKEEKINPLGGCLPILVQMPVFIALYWMLMESVEMRQAPFMLWIQDLSIADPYFVLPLIMGATMMIQQKLNPTPMDPTQAKVMMVLPIVFTVFFAFFPAGLVLYWVVNNALSILQQWYITRIVIAEK